MHLSYSWPSHVFITSMCSSHTCRERRLQMAVYFCMLHINTNQIIFVYIVQTNHMSHYLQLTVGRQHGVFISVCLYFIVIKQEYLYWCTTPKNGEPILPAHKAESYYTLWYYRIQLCGLVKLVLLFGAPFPKMVLLFGAHNSKKWSTILLNGSPFWSFVQQILQCSKWSMILVSKNDMVLFSSPFFYQKVDECISYSRSCLTL